MYRHEGRRMWLPDGTNRIANMLQERSRKRAKRKRKEGECRQMSKIDVRERLASITVQFRSRSETLPFFADIETFKSALAAKQGVSPLHLSDAWHDLTERSLAHFPNSLSSEVSRMVSNKNSVVHGGIRCLS